MSHREILFPSNYSKGATGGDGLKTIVIEYDSGLEDRIIKWSKIKGKWNVAHMLKDIDATKLLQAFWLAVGYGKAYTFLFKAWHDFCADMSDWTDADAISAGTIDPTNIHQLPLIGVGDSTNGTDGTSQYQLIKTYELGGNSYDRTIYKPAGTKATGSITFSGNPSNGHTITINGTAFTFVTGTPSTNEIKIGATLNNTLTNTYRALNLSTNSSVDDATYSFVFNSGVLSIEHDTPGKAGNSFTLAASNATPSSSTLTGGLDTTRIWVDGTEKTNGSHFTVNNATGIVTFTSGNRPLIGQQIRSWYEFFRIVRFDTDLNEMAFEREGAFDIRDWPEINLIEVKQAT